jgi:hypothetical protein
MQVLVTSHEARYLKLMVRRELRHRRFELLYPDVQWMCEQPPAAAALHSRFSVVGFDAKFFRHTPPAADISEMRNGRIIEQDRRYLNDELVVTREVF